MTIALALALALALATAVAVGLAVSWAIRRSRDEARIVEVFRAEDDETFAARFCAFAESRLGAVDRVSHFAAVARLVDRCHYNLVHDGLMGVLYNQDDELEDLAEALREVGAVTTAGAVEALVDALAEIPADARSAVTALGELIELVGAQRYEALEAAADWRECGRALVAWLDEHRDAIEGQIGSRRSRS